MQHVEEEGKHDSFISYALWTRWSEIWTVNLQAISFNVLPLGHLRCQKVSSPCFDLKLKTLGRGWEVKPGFADIQTTSYPRFWVPPFLNPLHPPSPSLGSCLIPLLTSPPWYSHYIPSGYSQSLWNAGGIPGITGGWLAGWLLLGIGNMLPYSWGKQQRKLLSNFSLHLSLAFFIRVRMNKWMDRRKTGTPILVSILLPLLPFLFLSGLRNKGEISPPFGESICTVFFHFSEEQEVFSLSVDCNSPFLLLKLTYGEGDLPILGEMSAREE